MWGYINTEGEEVIPCVYTSVGPFSVGLAGVGNEEGCGYINTEGDVMVPLKYKRVVVFSEGYGGVQNKDGLWGYINTEGEEVVPCKYKSINKDGVVLKCKENNGKTDVYNIKTYKLMFRY